MSRESLAPASAPAAPARFGNVLFLSADSKMIYAYVGVLKAMEEYGLEVDLVLTESKAALVGAAWALGYGAADIERNLLRRPLETLLGPAPAGNPAMHGLFPAEGPDPVQWKIPLQVQTLQTRGTSWSDLTGKENREYLGLSWMVARMTHEAPGGPVADISGTQRRLAVQVSDLSGEQGSVLTAGDLQNVLKGSLLPVDVVRARPRLWPFGSGSLVTGHGVMWEKLPFSCDRIIVVQPGRNLRPPSLESGPKPWTDSLNERAMRRRNVQPNNPIPVLTIELNPQAGFDPREPDAARWIELGYTSTLRSMDLLKSAMTVKPDSLRAPAAKARERLGLDRLSANPLASGGRELLLDIVRETGSRVEDSSGEAAMASLVGSGFYSDIDIEWSRSQGGEASLVFDARAKSMVEFRSGWNVVFTGEDITDRSPELYGNLAWTEPFYIPFRIEAGALMGGHRPGYEARAMITPVYPLHLELGFSRTHWEMLYPVPPDAAGKMGAWEFPKLRRDLSQIFLRVFPFRNAYLHTAVQRHEMKYTIAPEDPADRALTSTDFQETAFLGFGKPGPSGILPQSLRLRLRNLNRVNTFGTLRFSTTNFESRLRLSLGDFHLIDQFYWSDQSDLDFAMFDLLESGSIDVFTFQEEYFFAMFRSRRFQDVKLEYSPEFGNAGFRIIAGAYNHYSPAIFLDQADTPMRFHWEVQGGYRTPLGNLRAGAGGLDGEAPIFFVRLGAGLGLGFEGE